MIQQTREEELVSSEQVFVIGMGAVGSRLADSLRRVKTPVVEVTRTTNQDRAASSEPGLRVVCVREDDLAPVLDRLGPRDPSELVTIQNGWVRDLVPKGSTRGLIWFTAKGDFFRPLRPSPFAGPAGERLATALAAEGIPAEAVDAGRLDPLDADKMGFTCVVGLPLAVHGCSLEAYLREHADEARAVWTEAVSVCCEATGCSSPESGWDRFVADVQPIGWVAPQRAKALEWRNGAVVRLARDLGLEAPVNQRLLAAHG